MKDLQTLLSMLDRDVRAGKFLPTAQLTEEFTSSRPLNSHDLHVLVQCLIECSEQVYEYYRPLIDLFREEIRHTSPDEETIGLAIALGILDDEDWEG